MDLLELPESNRLLMDGERLPLALSFLPGLEGCNDAACTGVLSTEWVDCIYMYNIHESCDPRQVHVGEYPCI